MTTTSPRSASSRFFSLLEELRPHQWVKNLLVFVPLVTSHRFFEIPKLGECLLAFVCISCCASGIYIINDLFDLAADRRHPVKCNRPFASGRLPAAAGPPLALLLLAVGMGGALVGGTRGLVVCLGVYAVVSLAYSACFKEYVLLDVFLLAGLYILRILAGGEATGIPISEWLMAFGLFFFLSLAFAKRYTELLRLEGTSMPTAMRRGYHTKDLDFIASIGCTSGYLAILVFALYINSPEMRLLYRHPLLLWLICPLLLYWLSRVQLLSSRGELHDDPVIFAITDRMSWLTVAAIVAVVLVST